MYRLVFQSGALQGRRLVVRQIYVLIGRDADCHIPLSDDIEVALKHATIEEKGTRTLLTPLSGPHSTTRNGALITESVILRHNDILCFGQTQIQFQELVVPQQQSRETRSRGILQPVTFLAVLCIAFFQFSLLLFLFNWNERIITPQVEQLDREKAEEMAEIKAEAEAAQAAKPSPTTVVSPVVTHLDTVDEESLQLLTQVSEPAVLSPDDLSPLPEPVVAESVINPIIAEPLKENPSPTPAPRPAPDLTVAQQLLSEAIAAAEFADYAKASRLFARIHKIYPKFLAAYSEHARIEENQGHFQLASDLWGKLMELSEPGSTPYRLAMDERQRLARTQTIQTAAQKTTIPDLKTLPRKLKIGTVDIQKLPKEVDIEEMRILQIPLQLDSHAAPLDPATVHVFVTFYDEDIATGDIQPTRAITPRAPFTVEGSTLRPGDSRNISASYTVPTGLRDQEQREHRKNNRYYGYVIRAYVGSTLQDASAKPTKLLQLPLSL